jgi:hypothetical protein
MVTLPNVKTIIRHFFADPGANYSTNQILVNINKY